LQPKESHIEESPLISDPMHMLIRIPPKYAVSHVIEFIKEKSAIRERAVHSRRSSGQQELTQ